MSSQHWFFTKICPHKHRKICTHTASSPASQSSLHRAFMRLSLEELLWRCWWLTVKFFFFFNDECIQWYNKYLFVWHWLIFWFQCWRLAIPSQHHRRLTSVHKLKLSNSLPSDVCIKMVKCCFKCDINIFLKRWEQVKCMKAASHPPPPPPCTGFCKCSGYDVRMMQSVLGHDWFGE